LFITLIYLLQFAADKPWTISETDIYAPLDQNGYAVSDAFHFYLMDAKECRIRIYDSDGRFIKSVGGKGEGPGEFHKLFGVRFEMGLLYGLDPMASRLNVFDEGGFFLTSHKTPPELPFSFPYAAKMVEGWVFFSHRDKSIIWVDDTFENQIVLAEVEKTQSSKDVIVPVAEKPVFAASKDRQKVFVYPGTGKFEILVYDVLSKSFKKPISKDIPPVPLGKTAGEELYKHKLSYLKLRGKQTKPQYPNFFPAISHMVLDADGLLLIFPGVHIWNKNTPAIVLGENGNEAVSRFPTIYHARIMAIVGTYAFVSVYHEGEMGVRRVPINELGRFFQENPNNR